MSQVVYGGLELAVINSISRFGFASSVVIAVDLLSLATQKYSFSPIAYFSSFLY